MNESEINETFKRRMLFYTISCLCLQMYCTLKKTRTQCSLHITTCSILISFRFFICMCLNLMTRSRNGCCFILFFLSVFENIFITACRKWTIYRVARIHSYCIRHVFDYDKAIFILYVIYQKMFFFYKTKSYTLYICIWCIYGFVTFVFYFL